MKSQLLDLYFAQSPLFYSPKNQYQTFYSILKYIFLLLSILFHFQPLNIPHCCTIHFSNLLPLHNNSTLRNLQHINQSMRKASRKRTLNWDDSNHQKINQEEETFQKVNNNFKVLSKRPSHHLRIATVIKEQIRRPETSKTLKKDYKQLMNLLECNKMITESRERSMISYKNMKCINTKNSYKNMYSPVLAEINITQGNLAKKKYKKYDLQKFKNYMNNKQVKEDSQQAFVQKALLNGILEIQSLIPVDAKLHKKLSLFGQLLQQQKHKHIEEVKNLMEKQRDKGMELTKKFQIYLVNYYLIKKLMHRTFADSYSAMELKIKNNEIYSLIKNEMVGEIIKQEKFRQMLVLMQEHQEKSGKFVSGRKKQIGSWARKKAVQRMKLEKRSGNSEESSTSRTVKGKENEITIQFEKFYELAQQRLSTAQMQFKMPSNRKNNYYSVIQLKSCCSNV